MNNNTYSVSHSIRLFLEESNNCLLAIALFIHEHFLEPFLTF